MTFFSSLQFNSLVTSHLHLLTLFLLLLVLANQHQASANSVHRHRAYLPASANFDESRANIYAEPESLAYGENSPEFDRFAVSSQRRSEPLPRKSSRTTHLSNMPVFNLRHGVLHILPYKKRTIPLELQKALYAHGIVGRRR